MHAKEFIHIFLVSINDSYSDSLMKKDHTGLMSKNSIPLGTKKFGQSSRLNRKNNIYIYLKYSILILIIF